MIGEHMASVTWFRSRYGWQCGCGAWRYGFNKHEDATQSRNEHIGCAG